MKTSARLLIFLAAVILFGAGALTGSSLIQTKVAPPLNQNQQNQTQSASVLIDTGADLLGFPNIEVKGSDTVWSVLDRLARGQADLAVQSEQYKDMGVLVKSIKGFVNGTDGQYWQYWVNNKYAEVAADKQAVQPGDVIMWKFTKSLFKEY